MKQNSLVAITPSESTAVNYLRALAFLLILGDHFFVFLKVPHLSSILVVGVQLFFIISGFLYGKREITDWKAFFIKRIKKIYVPFIIFLLFIFLVYWLLEPTALNWKKSVVYLLNLQGFDSICKLIGGGIPYLSHLWFITILFCCLFITPVLQWARKFGVWSIVVVSLLFAFNLWHLHQTPLYILLYALAYFLASSSCRVKKFYALFSIICCLSCIPIITWHDMDLFTWPSMLIKSASAMAMLFVLQSVFYHFDVTKTDSVSMLLGKYSYEGYLVHPTMLMGPIALCSGNYSLIANVAIFVVSVAILSIMLKLVSRRIAKVL